jgi:hydrogenase nickel insertion protein HypA
MHEFSVANQAVDKIVKIALTKKVKRICRVEFQIGELSLLGKDQISFWMKEMLKLQGEVADDVQIDFKTIRTAIKCNCCGYEGDLDIKDRNRFYVFEDIKDTTFKNKISNDVSSTFYSHTRDFSVGIRCPSCKHGDIEIKRGREFILNRIQVEV